MDGSASRRSGCSRRLYHPQRVLTPMRRSNPLKGRDEDPGFVPISWDEALDHHGTQRLN
jgi:phenylacetyl-CoA:acceptor oxidoreductase